MSAPQHSTVVVIGAGPAGLALGKALRDRGIPFVILEKGAVGNSWDHMPRELELVSPWKTNWLTRDDAGLFEPNAQLSRAEFAQYLKHFAARYQLPVQAGCEVDSVEQANGGFLMRTSRGNVTASCVVCASGYFSRPVRPFIPGESTTTIPRLHFAEMGDARRVASLAGDSGTVLIVGHRLSAGQTALQLHDAGLRVAISHRSPIRFGVSDWLWPLVYRVFAHAEWVRLRLGQGRAGKLDVVMQGGRVRDLIRSQAIQTFGKIERIEDDTVLFDDGRALKPNLIIDATGFAPTLKYLEPLALETDPAYGLPNTREMESSSVPGLYFIGFEMLRNFQSRFLRGIREDALVLAGKIAEQVSKWDSPEKRTDVSNDVENTTATSHARVHRESIVHENLMARRAVGLCIYYLRIPVTWLALTIHNSWGILNVLDIIWLRPMRGGLIDEHHPFCTGIDPATGTHIWHRNVVFKSPRREVWPDNPLAPDPDDEIIRKVGEHLRKQVLIAARSENHPTGQAAPMPPGILFIHGGVHFNGVWLLFNDFADAIRHYSDPKFAAEFRRLVREEKREPVTLFRDRDYDRLAFARFVCFMRTVFPWFSNCNGPKKFVLWGNPSPYPAVNTITGNWIRETRALKTEQGRATVARAPVQQRYFQGHYAGERETTRWPENLLAYLTHKRIELRGERENLYFVDKRKIRRGFRFGPEPIPGLMQRLSRWFRRKAPASVPAQRPLNQPQA